MGEMNRLTPELNQLNIQKLPAETLENLGRHLSPPLSTTSDYKELSGILSYTYRELQERVVSQNDTNPGFALLKDWSVRGEGRNVGFLLGVFRQMKRFDLIEMMKEGLDPPVTLQLRLRGTGFPKGGEKLCVQTRKNILLKDAVVEALRNHGLSQQTVVHNLAEADAWNKPVASFRAGEIVFERTGPEPDTKHEPASTSSWIGELCDSSCTLDGGCDSRNNGDKEELYLSVTDHHPGYHCDLRSEEDCERYLRKNGGQDGDFVIRPAVTDGSAIAVLYRKSVLHFKVKRRLTRENDLEFYFFANGYAAGGIRELLEYHGRHPITKSPSSDGPVLRRPIERRVQ